MIIFILAFWYLLGYLIDGTHGALISVTIALGVFIALKFLASLIKAK